MADFFNGAGGGIIGGALGMIGNIAGTAMANAQNRENIELQNKLNIEQWNRENAYNAPINQMRRLKEAGLNPNLMYGNGAGSMLSAPSPGMQANREIPLHVDPLTLAQIGNIKADTQLKQAQAGNQGAQADLARNQIKVGDSVILYNKALSSMTDSQRKNIEAQTEFLGKQTEVANSQIALNQASVVNMTVSQQQRWVELAIRSQEVGAICDKYAAETDLSKAQLEYVGLLGMAKVYNLRADTALKKAQEGLTNKQISQCEQVIENLKVSNGQMSWQLDMDKKYEESERSIKIRQAVADILSVGAQATRGSAFGISFSPGANFDDYRKLAN